MDNYFKASDILDKAFGTDAYFPIKSILLGTKTADVAPVRHGRWYFAEDSVFRCSECDRICFELNAPYCYCGARMDGKEDNT